MACRTMNHLIQEEIKLIIAEPLMNDDRVRAILSSQHLRILQSQQTTADFREILHWTNVSISETQRAILRSDRLIESLSKAWCNQVNSSSG
jgi:hypothetical protein